MNERSTALSDNDQHRNVGQHYTNLFAHRLRKLFSYAGTIIVPDRGKITITVDGSTPGLAFAVYDADGNLLGDGVITDLDFTIESFHLNNQPDLPRKPKYEHPTD